MSIEINKTSYTFGKFGYFILLVSLIGLFIWQLPITFLAPLVSSKSQCKISLFQPQGSIWSGSASIAISETSSNGTCKPPLIVTERIFWSSACRLQDLQCSTNISHSKIDKPLEIHYGWGKIKVVNNQIQLPANFLELFGGPWNLLHPQGLLDIHWNDLVLFPVSEGTISIKIMNLVSSISKVAPLGSYELKINFHPNWSANLITLNGPLILNGQGQLTNQSIHFEGTASSTPDAKNSLVGLLSVIGIKNGNTYQLKF